MIVECYPLNFAQIGEMSFCSKVEAPFLESLN
jgi:hypothetical protein